MPTDIRHIMFDLDEVVQAYKSFRRRKGDPLPIGDVTSSVAEHDKDGKSVRFRLSVLPRGAARAGKARLPSQEIPFVIEAADLATALREHCHDQAIPLPAKGKKVVTIIDEQVCLISTNVVEIKRSEGLGSTRRLEAAGPGSKAQPPRRI